MLTDPKILKKIDRIIAAYQEVRFHPVAGEAMEYTETRLHFRREPGPESSLKWRPAWPGLKWGGSGVTGWFRGETRLPKECAGRKVFVRFKCDAETLFFVSGEEKGVFDVNHPVVLAVTDGRVGQQIRLAFEAYSGHTFPGTQPYEKSRVVEAKSKTFDGVDLCLEREDVTAFVFDLMTLKQLHDKLDDHSLRRGKIARCMQDVFTTIDARPGDRPDADWLPGLARARRAMRPLLASKNGPTAPQFGLIGHSHMDTAWLWPIAETWRKCARTYSSMLNLMEQYPEATFIQAAPAHADAMRRLYPGIYRRLKEQVAAGRWEPNGAMWVEPDCNLPSGEAFVRQLLVGQRATREMFGYTADTLWLPDVFGYSAALPQILRGCGVEFFCTTKMSWNDTTRLPYDTFVWKGIDGSGVLAHFNNVQCWTGPETLINQWNHLQHKDVQDRHLCAYGHGDGGGGPMNEMLELARRVEDLEGCPRAKHTTVSAFMRGLRDELPDLPQWIGELYLELHRGALTAIAAVKRGNRKAEYAMREAELLATLATLRGAKYPAKPLLELWQELLIDQFHDILPGSSINKVNDEAVASFAKIISGANELSAAALETLAGPRPPRLAHYLAVNTLSWDLTGELAIDGAPVGACPVDPPLPSQPIETLDGRRQLIVHGLELPALGAATITLGKRNDKAPSAFKVGANTVETPFAKVRFGKAGRILSLIDKSADRDIVRPGGALNTFWLGQNVPLGWDNWDIDADQRLKMQAELRLLESATVADGPLQLRLRREYQLGAASTLKQDIVFHATTRRIDFETIVDWADKNTLLKVGFELDIHAHFARHEIQYGHLERPTHQNRPEDRARFEVCAHKWTDLSENGYGVALLNDCKYGVGVHGGELRLTLITSGTHPDDRADAGRHAFTYSLLPHDGAFSVESVIRPAYELNVPPLVSPVTAAAEGLASLLTIDAPNVIIESIKWAEEGRAYIIRLYEAGKTATHATLKFNAPLKAVTETDMLEENPQTRKTENGQLRFYIRPFEIKTYRCEV